MDFLMNFLQVKVLLIYLLVMNVVSFLMMWYDKHEAQTNQWRVSEKALFAFALFGGSIGGIAGMQIFRHKTKKWYFQFGFPIILVIQLGLIIWAGVNGYIK